MAAAELKSPAYAKRLIEARRAGRHPEHVVVIYGNDWRVDDCVTRLAVKPGEALGLSWSAVAGLPAQVIDRSAEHDGQPEKAGHREVYWLMGEIALLAAGLTLTSWREGIEERRVGDIAFDARKWHAGQRQMAWPAWWSDDIDRVHGQNTQRWLSEISSILCAA